MAADSKSFGSFLRTLRKERGFSLQAVVDASRRVSARAPISKGYLAQVESTGKVPSIERLCTLARLYGVPIADLVEAIPDVSTREARRVDLIQNYEDRTEILDPIMPGSEEADAEIMDELGSRAPEVAIPLRDSRVSMELARAFCLWAAIPAYLHLYPRLAQEYRRLRRPILDRAEPRLYWTLDEEGPEYSPLRRDPASSWKYVASEFKRWFVYEKRLGVEAVKALSRWNYDFTRHAGTCTFGDEALESQYGFADVPIVLVRGSFWRDVAQRLAPVGKLGPPPNATGLVSDYLAELIIQNAAAETLLDVARQIAKVIPPGRQNRIGHVTSYLQKVTDRQARGSRGRKR